VKDVGYLTYDTIVAAPVRQKLSPQLPMRSNFGISATNDKNTELIGYKRGSTNVNNELLTGLTIPAKVVNNIDNYDRNLNFKRPIAKKRNTGSSTSKYIVNPDYINNKNNYEDTKETLYKIGDAISSIPQVITKTKEITTSSIGSAQNFVSKIQSVPSAISSNVNKVKSGIDTILETSTKISQKFDRMKKKFNRIVDSASRSSSTIVEQTNNGKTAVQKLNDEKLKSNAVVKVKESVAVTQPMVKEPVVVTQPVKIVTKIEAPIVIDPIEKERNERLFTYTLSLLKSVLSFSGALIGFSTKLTFAVAQDATKEAKLRLVETTDTKPIVNAVKIDDVVSTSTTMELVVRPNIPDAAKEQEVAIVKNIISRIATDAENVPAQSIDDVSSSLASTLLELIATPNIPDAVKEQEVAIVKNIISRIVTDAVKEHKVPVPAQSIDDVSSSTSTPQIELIATPNIPDAVKEQEVAVVKNIISRIVTDAVNEQTVTQRQESDKSSMILNEQAEKKRCALIDDAILRDQIRKKAVKYEAVEMKKTMQEAKVKEIAEVISKVFNDEDEPLQRTGKKLNAYQEFVSRSMKKLKAENAVGNSRDLMKRIAEMWKIEKESKVEQM
jgi:hypothetical protein